MMVKKVFLTRFILLLFVSFILSWPSSLAASESVSSNDRKAVILVIDQIGIQDLMKSKTPNIDKLIKKGGIGLMNIRPEAVINTNRASTYLSLGMGTRATAPERQEWRFGLQKDNIWKLQDILVVKNKVNEKKQERLGLTGKIARQKGFRVGLIGNADNNGRQHRETALIAMDENGTIPYVSMKMPIQGKELKKILSSTDITFIDLGTTTRVQTQENTSNEQFLEKELRKAIEENDKLLGMVIKEIGLENNFFMIVTPNPSPQGLKDINLALTPVVVYNPFVEIENGLLTSASTRREGLVTNLNFVPTLFSYFGINGLGETIKVTLTEDDPKETTVRNERLFLNLNKTRYLLHGTYIFLISLNLILFYTKALNRLKKQDILSWISLITLNIPLASLLAPLFLDYSKVFFGHLIIVLTSTIITWLSKKYLGNFIKALSVSSIITVSIIFFDLFRGNKYLVQTPFGFNDVIIGGRYYGINNDLMGILLGAALVLVFMTSQLFNLKKTHQVLLVLGTLALTSLALSPFFGANVGGTIGSVFILIVSIFMVLNLKLNIQRIIGIIAFVLVVEVGIAALENYFSSDLTHAGKLYLSVANNGFIVLIEMIKVKLVQIGLMLILPPWNFILFFQSYIIWRLLKEDYLRLRGFQEKFPHFFTGIKTLVIGSIVVFVFNDTGVISSAIMLIHALIPFGYLSRVDSEK